MPKYPPGFFNPPDDFQRRYGAPLKVRRPKAGEVYIVHPTFHAEAVLVERNGKFYPVKPDDKLLDALIGEEEVYDLYLAATSTGELFILPVKRQHDNMRAAIEVAKGVWKEHSYSTSTKEYEAREPEKEFPEPDWTFEDFESVYLRSFEENAILDLDHKVVKRILKDRDK